MRWPVGGPLRPRSVPGKRMDSKFLTWWGIMVGCATGRAAAGVRNAHYGGTWSGLASVGDQTPRSSGVPIMPLLLLLFLHLVHCTSTGCP